MTLFPHPQFSGTDWLDALFPALILSVGLALTSKRTGSDGELSFGARVLRLFPVCLLFFVPARMIGRAFERGAMGMGYGSPVAWSIGTSLLSIAVTGCLLVIAVALMNRVKGRFVRSEVGH
jgi:hypothetical protein